MAVMTPRQVAIVGFKDMMALDLTGPLEAFSSASPVTW